MRWEGREGNFAVVGREKTLFSGVLNGPKSLFCFTIIACNFENCTAHRRSLMQQAATEDAAHAAVAHESSDTVRSRKAPCQAPPDNLEIGDTYHSRERSCAGEKIEHQNVCMQAAQPPPSTTTTTTHTTCTSMSASCCCCCRSVLLLCGKENPPPPNEARAIRSEWRRAISAQLAGRVVHVSLAAWVGPMVSKYPAYSNESS